MAATAERPNYFVAVAEASKNTQTSMDHQSMRDALFAQFAATVLADIYKYFSQALGVLSSAITTIANSNIDKDQKSSQMSAKQAEYNKKSSDASASEGQADGALSSAKSAVQNDSTAEQTLAQVIQALLSGWTALSQTTSKAIIG